MYFYASTFLSETKSLFFIVSIIHHVDRKFCSFLYIIDLMIHYGRVLFVETGYDSGDEEELNKNASMDVFRDVVKSSYSKVVESHSFSTKKHLSANRSGNHIDVEVYSGLRIRYHEMENLKSWIKFLLDSCIIALSWHISP